MTSISRTKLMIGVAAVPSLALAGDVIHVSATGPGTSTEGIGFHGHRAGLGPADGTDPERSAPRKALAFALGSAPGRGNGGPQCVRLGRGFRQRRGYPDGQITMVVPFSAGGPTDTVTRLIAEPMSAKLGQQIVVQNVEGAGGTLGAGQVARATPDGYTVLMHHIGMSTAPTLYPQLPYAPLEDFETVGLVTEVPMTIVGRKDLAPNTLQELVAYVRGNPGGVTLATAGVGAASQLCGLLIERAMSRRHRGALRGNGSGADRSRRGAGGHDVRPDHQHHGADHRGWGQGLRGDHAGAGRGPAGPSHHRGGGAAGRSGLGVARPLRAGRHPGRGRPGAHGRARRRPAGPERGRRDGQARDRAGDGADITPQAHTDQLRQQIDFWGPSSGGRPTPGG